MADFLGSISFEENDPNYEIIAKVVNMRSSIIDCAEFLVNNPDISKEDFLQYWAYYQHSIAGYTLPDALDETLTELTCNEIKTTEIVEAILSYAKEHPDEVKFNDNLGILERDEEKDKEKRFILGHKKELLERCPVDLMEIKAKYQESIQNDKKELAELYRYLFFIIINYGAFPQLWRHLKPFAQMGNNPKVVKELMKPLVEIDVKYRLTKFIIGDGRMEEVLKELELDASNANNYKLIDLKELLEEERG